MIDRPVARVCLGIALLLTAIGRPRDATAQPPQVAPATSGPTTVPAGAFDPSLAGAKYLDDRVPLDQRVDDLFARLTPTEKASLLHGPSEMEMGGLPRVGLRSFGTTDGPQGVRGVPATAFPCGLAMAATWDPAAVADVGAAIAEEALSTGSRMQLGPGLNVMRSPLGGRDFEYYGEDPFLAGQIAAGYVRGMQGRGVAACAKHFVGNEQERWRTTINVTIPERALREIYARPFEICCREAQPWAVMAAYNKFDGDYCCHSAHLLVDLLRDDWHWDGQVVSDWGAWHGTTKAVNGGSDIEMGGWTNAKRDAATVAAVAAGRIRQDRFDAAVRANLRLFFRVGAIALPSAPQPTGSINTPAHQAVAERVAEAATVLLKNDGGLLPLDAGRVRSVAVVGPAADWAFQTEDLRVSGGSGAVFPPHEVTPVEGIRRRLGTGVTVTTVPGYRYTRARTDADVTDVDLPAAVAAAKGADVAIVCVGTNHSYDRESLGWGTVPGADRPDLDPIGPAAELIAAVRAVNPRTVVVLSGTGPVSVEPWIDGVPAVLECWYPGMEGGTALARVLFGDVDPSGRLPCTFGRRLADWKCQTMGPTVFPGTGNNGAESYDDGIWVGYRWFDHAGIAPRFPFGFGLSYTTFRTSDLHVSTATDGGLSATVAVTNTGNRPGVDVAELYVSPPASPVERPVRELAGFARVALDPGQTRQVTIAVDRRSLAYWGEGGWVVTPGAYRVAVGASSRDLPVTASVDVR
jgi:beta-glucosidase